MLSGNTHLVKGNSNSIPILLALLEKEGIRTVANPDVYIRSYTHFGVEEARELRDRAGSRALSDARRVFIVATPTMTGEAQNALLKTLEEPPADSMFFLIVASPETLLPTLRSRVQRLSLSIEAIQESIDVRKFLSAKPEMRLDMLKPLLEKDNDDKRDLGLILSFLASVEHELARRKERHGLRALYRARKYIGDKGALVKPLLEQVALLLPRA